ncbi:MAG TPA: C2 family cysteine protease, partial [Acetobacteraceae bacterium]|nr:C2 family cysteine protease [Acetobacteraceae bacterium]
MTDATTTVISATTGSANWTRFSRPADSRHDHAGGASGTAGSLSGSGNAANHGNAAAHERTAGTLTASQALPGRNQNIARGTVERSNQGGATGPGDLINPSPFDGSGSAQAAAFAVDASMTAQADAAGWLYDATTATQPGFAATAPTRDDAGSLPVATWDDPQDQGPSGMTPLPDDGAALSGWYFANALTGSYGSTALVTVRGLDYTATVACSGPALVSGTAATAVASPVSTSATLTNVLYLQEAGETSLISVYDINQGQIGDCFLLSSIGEIALWHPSGITNMIQANANGTETVTLYLAANGSLPTYGTTAFESVQITVNNTFPGNSVNNGATQDVLNGEKEIWVQVLEKAVATLGGGYNSIANGGNPMIAMEELTGQAATDMSPSAVTVQDLQSYL